MKTTWLTVMLAAILCAVPVCAAQIAPELPTPDARYKTDVLLIVAHPDDDVLLGAWLARIVLDGHKNVSVIYATNGDGGGNNRGPESGLALGAVREMEARRALAVYGIDRIWFLGGHDTPGQNPLRSLDSWNHGRILNNLIRLVRITRPEVIVTWLPDSVAGENHGDHQAAGVLGVEAFDAAGDPSVFPEQLSAPYSFTGYANLAEGLEPWQAKKLYFFTDAFEVDTSYWHNPAEKPTYRKHLDEGTGPVFDATSISASQKVSYAELVVRQQAAYATQDGALGEAALARRDWSLFAYPVPLIFGKSLVGGAVTGDVFEGVTAGTIPFHGTRTESFQRDAFGIGNPWRFYAAFWRQHDLQRLADLMPTAELAANPGDKLTVPLVACNTTVGPIEVAMQATLPEGWTNNTSFRRYPVQPGACYTIQEQVVAPAAGKPGWQLLTWKATVDEHPLGEARMRVYVGMFGGLPQ